MHAFSYHSPKTVRQAASLLGKSDDAKLLAGGQTLLPTMKQRLASPTHLVDLGKVEGLASIEQKGRNIVIGAMTCHADVATSAVVLQAIPALAALAGGIGDAQVRNRGTIGGSLANNDPAADYPEPGLPLCACRRIRGEKGRGSSRSGDGCRFGRCVPVGRSRSSTQGPV